MIFDGDRSFVGDNLHWFGPYVRDIADRMGLKDWSIYVQDEKPDNPDTSGMCEVSYGRKHASLRFDVPESPEKLRHTVVHELLHCHEAPLVWCINSIHPVMSQQTFDVWTGSMQDAREIMIDSITDAWAPLLPLPLHEIEVNDRQSDGDEAEQVAEQEESWKIDLEKRLAIAHEKLAVAEARAREAEEQAKRERYPLRYRGGGHWETQPDGSIAHIVDTPNGPQCVGYHYPCTMPPGSYTGKRPDWTRSDNIVSTAPREAGE